MIRGAFIQISNMYPLRYEMNVVDTPSNMKNVGIIDRNKIDPRKSKHISFMFVECIVRPYLVQLLMYV